MKKNIYDKLIELLFKNERYVSDDGKLLKSAVYSDIMTMNEELLSLLFSSEILKKKFFSKSEEIPIKLLPFIIKLSLSFNLTFSSTPSNEYLFALPNTLGDNILVISSAAMVSL